MSSTTPTPWIKASRSADQGACVQMRRNGQFIEMSDSKQGSDSPVLRFTPTEIAAYFDGVGKAEFQHLLTD
jgi:hypothetical protein